MVIINFRDFGGMSTQLGLKVKTELLFRSGHLGNITSDDMFSLTVKDFQTIADLRYAGERAREPSAWPLALLDRICSHSGDRRQAPPHLELLRTNTLTAGSVRSFYIKTYTDLPFDPIYRPLFTDVVRRMAERGAATLIHCSAGKDRTGILCALILDLLGVARRQIEEDYLLSRGAPGFETIKQKIQKKAVERLGSEIPKHALDALMGVETAYISSTFAAIENRFGGTSEYFLDSGVEPGHVAALRAHYLVP